MCDINYGFINFLFFMRLVSGLLKVSIRAVVIGLLTYKFDSIFEGVNCHNSNFPDGFFIDTKLNGLFYFTSRFSRSAGK